MAELLCRVRRGRRRLENRDISARHLSDLLLKHCVLGFHICKAEFEIMIPPLDSPLLSLKRLNFETFALTRRLSRTTITQYSFDSALLFFILGLGPLSMRSQSAVYEGQLLCGTSLPWRKVCLWFWKLLAPRFPLFDRLLLGGGRIGRRLSRHSLLKNTFRTVPTQDVVIVQGRSQRL